MPKDVAVLAELSSRRVALAAFATDRREKGQFLIPQAVRGGAWGGVPMPKDVAVGSIRS